MLYVSRIVLLNWMSFRGSHDLELGPTAYGVSAVRRGDAESSNWSGKSALVEAVEFALGGWQNKHRRHGAAGWVSEGEKHGGVQVVLSDGTNVVRRRDKTTSLAVNGAKGEEAQALLDRVLGSTSEDRRATCYVQQRQAARLVVAEPSERVAVVSEWLRLDKLDAAAEFARKQLADVQARARSSADARRVAEALQAEALGGLTLQQIEGEVGPVVDRRRAVDRESEGLIARVDLAERYASSRARIAEYEALVEEGKALAEKLAALDLPGLRAAHEQVRGLLNEAHSKWSEHTRREQEAHRLVRGEFDGRCPVIEMQCPARAEILAKRGEAKQQLIHATAMVKAARSAAEVASDQEKSALAQMQAAERLEERLASMRERARAMRPAYEEARSLPEPEDAAVLRERLRQLQVERAQLIAKAADLTSRINRVMKAQEKIDEARRLEESLGLTAVRQAEELLSLARRRVAEQAVAEIERGANAVLSSAGVDLGVSVRWDREGGDSARACHACGWPYPKSERVKECGGCGAARGKNQVQRLEVDLTSRSGAAEDLAGMSMQLAAADWLRRDRSSAWACAVLDEPLSQADAGNRRAVGAKLWPMLRAAGFAQALVISHHADTLASLPGRILVESDGKWSTARVL